MKVGSKTVLINDIRSDRRSFDPIFIFEPLGERGTKTIMANKGELIFSERKLVLRLFDGHQLKITDREDGWCNMTSGNSVGAGAQGSFRGAPRKELHIRVFHGVAMQPWSKTNGQTEGYGG